MCVHCFLFSHCCFRVVPLLLSLLFLGVKSFVSWIVGEVGGWGELLVCWGGGVVCLCREGELFV